MASPGKRRETDLMKLMMAEYEIQMADGDRVGEFFVKFHGPKSTPYEGGVWKVHVELPEAYPYKSPSIGFINRLYHPNVDEMSGSVCLDVINQSWSPMYDLTNIFEVFLPQLLTYPNPTDPLNGEAAALQMREPERYRQKVIEYVQKYAKPEDFPSATCNDHGANSGSNHRTPDHRDRGDALDRNDRNDDDDDDSNFTMSDSDDDCHELPIGIPVPVPLSEGRPASSAIPIGDDGLSISRGVVGGESAANGNGKSVGGNSSHPGSSSGRDGVWSR